MARSSPRYIQRVREMEIVIKRFSTSTFLSFPPFPPLSTLEPPLSQTLNPRQSALPTLQPTNITDKVTLHPIRRRQHLRPCHPFLSTPISALVPPHSSNTLSKTGCPNRLKYQPSGDGGAQPLVLNETYDGVGGKIETVLLHHISISVRVR
jgi:hypothetical protein